MATLSELPSTASPLPTFNASHDPEFDTFLNLDQAAYPASESMKSNPSVISQPSMATPEASINDMSQSFSGPSHQYGDHQQQTGFPPDAVAHAMAYNDHAMGALRAGHQSFPMADSNFMHMKREESIIDFGAAPNRIHSEMDIETDNGNNKAHFLSHANGFKTQQFIDPTALGAHEMTLIPHPAPQAGRVYPGMHQQQAAMARAAQQQKQQAEIIRQQQQIRQRQAIPLTLPSRSVRPMDPVVEERISRLLQQMRQNSIGQDNGLSTTSSVLPQMAKLKKDEEDMDDDERLLASEEGKKLTSKERRQLRNKVSARAFRSRRKEYITQLEGEVASKTTENNELRVQNHALAEENTRLTDLTRMLLSSPHFSDVLNDLSTNGVPAQLHVAQPTQGQAQAQPQSQPVVSQTSIPTSISGTQQNFQVNMVMAPDNRTDTYVAGWNSGIDMNYNPSVFAVLDVPQGPVIDSEALSGKSSNFFEMSSEPSKLEVPELDLPRASLPQATKIVSGVADPAYEIDETDPSFALFLDDVSSTLNTVSAVSFNEIQPEKSSHYKLVVEQVPGEASEIHVCSFERLFSSMDAAFDRICRVTDHLL